MIIRTWISPPPPHSHIIRGHPCSYPITWTPPPPSQEKEYTPYLGQWLPLAITKRPLSWSFPWYLSRDYAQKVIRHLLRVAGANVRHSPQNTPPPPSWVNGNTHAAPYAFEWRGGGGGEWISRSAKAIAEIVADKLVWHKVFINYYSTSIFANDYSAVDGLHGRAGMTLDMDMNW